MNYYQVVETHRFKKLLKRLSKKYPSLKLEYLHLINELSKNPHKGTALGNNTFKIRLAVKSKGVGKSGGLRVITHFVVFHQIIYLISIYDKADEATISDAEIVDLIKDIFE